MDDTAENLAQLDRDIYQARAVYQRLYFAGYLGAAECAYSHVDYLLEKRRQLSSQAVGAGASA